MIPEPDGTACSLDTSTPDADWETQTKEWAAWKVAFDKETGDFYCYDTVGLTKTSARGTYPDMGKKSFMVILASFGDLKPTRGTLMITPDKLHFVIEKGPGQVPPIFEDVLPMLELAGWMLDEEPGKLRLFLKTNKGVFEICIKSANSSRIAQTIELFLAWLYAAKKTPEAEQAKALESPPADFMGQFPLQCNATPPEVAASIVHKFGKPFVHPLKDAITWCPVADTPKIVTGIPEPEPEEDYF